MRSKSNRRNARRKRLGAERLESRRLLAVDWTNPLVAWDVNQDRSVTPLDALVVLNDLSRNGARDLPMEKLDVEQPFLDVNRDDSVSPLDALHVINALGRDLQDGFRLSEGNFPASEFSIIIGVGQSEGTRNYRFEIDASFDTSSNQTIAEDTFAVYLKHPVNPAQGILEWSEPDSALFTLSGEKANYVPGVVRFDGRFVDIDLSSVSGLESAKLTFQLINTDGDTGSVVEIDLSENSVDPDGIEPMRFVSASETSQPGTPLTFASLASNQDLQLDLTNIQFDSSTGVYSAAIRAENLGEAIGRDLAVVFTGLPAGVSLRNASGSTLDGHPYLNLRSAMPSGGLGQNAFTSYVELIIDAPANRSFILSAETLVGEANRAPTLESVDDIVVRPGQTYEVPLVASDQDGDRLQFAVSPEQDMPTTLLKSDGTLVFSPAPDQVGEYSFEVHVSDGSLSSTETIVVRVEEDSVATTRVSGRVLDVSGAALMGMLVEIGGIQVVTGAAGEFTLDLGTGTPVSETLRIRGDLFAGEATYPFIAEKLSLMLGHEAFAGANNEILRPIYLPQLDVVGGTTVNPMIDMVVQQDLASSGTASIEIASGSLLNQQGTPFDGVLSITEVPTEFTPAALPDNLFTDLVVTIQPGEMSFATPAPLTLPNRDQHLPGTTLDLWSINPTTGAFEIVGEGRVTEDGSEIETISGGIRNSSWHFFARLLDGLLADLLDELCGCPKASAGTASEVELFTGTYLEHHNLVSYQSQGEQRGLSFWYDSQRAAPRPAVSFRFTGSQSSEVIGDPATFKRGIYARLSLTDGKVTVDASGADPAGSDFIGGENFWEFDRAALGSSVGGTLFADAGNLSTGVLSYKLDAGNYIDIENKISPRTGAEVSGRIVSVNSRNSPYGVGWGIAGLKTIVESNDGAVLIVDGSGSELLFDPPLEDGDGAYQSPAGDFSTLAKNTDGTFTRRFTDQSVEVYDAENRLASTRDRNNNETVFQYSTDGLLSRVVDPTGLATELIYSGGMISRVVDPVGRETVFQLDDQRNLIGVTDPDGAKRTWGYSDDSLLINEQTANGFQEKTFYDASGRSTGSVRADGSEVKIRSRIGQGIYEQDRTADSSNPPPAVIGSRDTALFTDGRGFVTEFHLNRAGQVNAVSDSLGKRFQLERNEDLRVIQETDANENVTLYEYDNRGNRISGADAISSQPAGQSAPSPDLFSGRVISAPIHNALQVFDDLDSDGISEVVYRSYIDDAWIYEPTHAWGESVPTPTDIPTNVHSIHFGTVNSDGLRDLFTIGRYGASPVAEIRLANAIGQYAARSQIPLPAFVSVRRSQALDVNGDQIDDLLIGFGPSGGSEGGELLVAIANADGTFADVQFIPMTGNPSPYSDFNVADFDGDGDHEIYVTTDAGLEIIEPGPEGLVSRTIPAIASNVCVGDIDGDGNVDISYSGSASRLYTRFGDGDSAVEEVAETLLERFPFFSHFQCMGVEDVDVGINKQLILRGTDPIGGGENNSVIAIPELGDSRNVVDTQLHVIGVNGFARVQFADLNGDEHLDLLASGGDSAEFLYAESTGKFISRVSLPRPDSAGKLMTTGLLNDDAYPEILVVSRDGDWQNITIDSPDADGNYSRIQDFHVPGDVSPASLTTAYIDDDEFLDVFYYLGQRYAREEALIFFGNGDGTVKEEPQIVAAPNIVSAALGDLSNDSIQDIAYTTREQIPGSLNFVYSLVVLKGTGNGLFGEPIVSTQEIQTHIIDLADLDLDGNTDIILGTNTSSRNEVYVRAGNADGSLGPMQLVFQADEFFRTTLADIDGDGFHDLVTSETKFNAVQGNLRLLRGNGDFSFSPVLVLQASDASTGETEIGDIDADGMPDILVTDYRNSRIGVYIAQPGGGYAPVRYYSTGEDPSDLVLDDLNNDGFLDIAVEANDIGLLINLASEIDGSVRRGSWETMFDETHNQPLVEIDELGRRTTFEIDSTSGDTLKMIQPGGLQTSWTYLNDGLVETTTDALGRTTKYEYSSSGMISSLTVAEGTAEETSMGYEYDAAGNAVSFTDANGNRTDMAYDFANRITRIEEPASAVGMPRPATEFEYDSMGNLVLRRDARGNETRYSYDGRNRVISTTDVTAGNLVTRYEYDAAGNLVRAIDPLGFATQYEYDARNQQVASIDPEGGVTRLRYDGNGNTIEITDPVNNRTRFAYDERDRMVSETDPLGATSRMEYDRVDNLTKTTDRLGRVTTFVYDDLDRLTEETWVDEGNAIVYGYDDVDNLVTVADSFSQLAYTYDARNRVQTVDTSGTPNVPSSLLQYTYDGVGNVLSVTDQVEGQDSVTTEYEYDGRNQLSVLQQSGDAVSDKLVDFVYNELGQYESIDRFSDLDRSNRVAKTTYTYDDLNRLTDLYHRDASDDPLAFFEYTFDDASRITAINDHHGTTSYTYDDRDQLTGADRDSTDPRGDESYSYDENGNRLTSSLHGSEYVTGPGNRLESDGTYAYEYDAEGNLILRTEITTDTVRQFEWDYRNRLVAVTDRDASGEISLSVQYVYDALDRRIAKHVDLDGDGSGMTGSKYFIYDREDVILDFDDPDGPVGAESHQQTMRYLHGPGADNVFAQESSETQWYLTDHLGTTHALIDSSANTLTSFSYDSFGSVETSELVLTTRLLFTGREWDPELGLYYYRARVFDTGPGRFISEDPIGFDSGDTNKYRYVFNDSIQLSDPYGLDVFVEDRGLHQSIRVENNEHSQAYSFAAFPSDATSWQLIASYVQPLNFPGRIYVDHFGGTKNPDFFLATSPGIDRIVSSVLEAKRGQRGNYNLILANCRTFSQSQFEAIKQALESKAVKIEGRYYTPSEATRTNGSSSALPR